MNLPILRPATEADLPDLLHLTESTPYGMTSLTHNRTFLESKIHRSVHSFVEKPDPLQPQAYLFVLEWEGRVVGTSEITAHIGLGRPFFAYNLLYEKLRCPYLNIDRELKVLHFINAHQHPSEIGTLFLSAKLGHKGMGKLLSLCRFLFIANFRSRFADTIIAELRGINQDGISPFWEALGRLFFQIEFPQADLLRAQHPQVIEELFPKHPIYLDLLPPEARSVVGVPHAHAIGALKILEKQGFVKSTYIDIFDAGPLFFAPTDTIQAVSASAISTVKELRSLAGEKIQALISNMHLQFRSTLAPILLEEGHITFHPDVAQALEIEVGDPVRYLLL